MYKDDSRRNIYIYGFLIIMKTTENAWCTHPPVWNLTLELRLNLTLNFNESSEVRVW